MLVVEDLDRRDDVNGVDRPCPGVGEDGDENVFFDIERPWIEREFPSCPREEGTVRDLGGHELA